MNDKLKHPNSLQIGGLKIQWEDLEIAPSSVSGTYPVLEEARKKLQESPSVQALQGKSLEELQKKAQKNLESDGLPKLHHKAEQPALLLKVPELVTTADTQMAPHPERELITGLQKSNDSSNIYVTKEDKALDPKSEQKPKSEFRASPFSIKVKLLTIISLIILLSFSTLIFLATFFFRKDNETRAKEINHKLADVLAQKIQTDIHSIADKIRLMAAVSIEGGREETSSQILREEFFDKNREMIYFGILRQYTGRTENLKNFFNNKFLSSSQLTKEEILTLNERSRNDLLSSFNGQTILLNLSAGFKEPILGLGIPFQKEGNRYSSIIVVYMQMSEFLKTFQSQGIIETFLVDVKGDVIAHPDPKVVFSRSNFLDLKIVEAMIKSKIDNGQTRYLGKDQKYYIGSFKKLSSTSLGIIAAVQEDKAFEEVYNIQRRNIYILIIGLNLSILVIYFFAKTISNPIISLLSATKQIEKGDYHLQIRPTTRDEIGSLTNSFLSMSKGLEEREKIKDAFGKFVNSEIAERAMRGEIKLGGEKKICAIFFSDIRGFTKISEGLAPEEVVEFLNEYMTEMVDCVNKTDGVVDKFIGDAIMAHWGAISSTGNDTENAVNAALMMRAALLKFNQGRGSTKKPIIKFGCGINTGAVISGQIGSEQRLEYTVIGDAVNLASRVEALNKPFGTDILITQDSYDFVKDIFKVEKMPSIKVKGKEAAQVIYAVLGRLDDPATLSSMTEVRRLVGIDFDERKPIEADEKEVKYEILDQ